MSEPNYEHMHEYDNAGDSYRHCTTKLRELKGQKLFYVGATSNPEGRLEEHANDKNMKKMFVLCKTKTKKQAEGLEKKLVGVFGKQRNNYSMRINNVPQEGGGEGLQDGENYIYVLFK